MKKLAILLSVLVLAAAIGIGVLVNRSNNTAGDLKDTQADLSIAEGQVTALTTELETAKAEAATGLEAASALEEALNKVSGLETQVAELTAGKETAEAKVVELQGLVDSAATEGGNLITTLDAALSEKAAAEEAKASLETQVADFTTQVTGLEAQVAELSAGKAALETQVADFTAQVAALETEKAELQTSVTTLETEKVQMEEAGKADADALTAKVTALEADMALAMASNDQLETEKAALEAKIVELESAANQQVEVPEAVPAPQIKHGLGMVTSIGSVADATAEKAGAAQVNTTVCSLTLDAEGRILSVVWDVQQTKVQFSLEGKPVELPAPEALLTKLEKGDAYGMRSRSDIGKEWFEQIDAFGKYVIGKTVEEVQNMPTFDRGDGSHNAVPDVEELKASVTITVGDYIASLVKAAQNAE